MIQGIKEDNTCFIIPHIQSELEGMFPWNVTVFEIIAWILCISSTMATLLYTIPVSYYVAFYFTFRLAYDFGLGILLDRQSKYKSFARVYFFYYFSLMYKLLTILITIFNCH